MPAPDKATEIKALISLVIAFFTALWGWVGWMILLLIICIFADYITGTWAAKAHGEWSSAAAREGLWHKLGEISALLVAALADIAIGVLLQSGAESLIGGLEYDAYLTMIVSVWYVFPPLSLCRRTSHGRPWPSAVPRPPPARPGSGRPASGNSPGSSPAP